MIFLGQDQTVMSSSPSDFQNFRAVSKKNVKFPGYNQFVAHTYNGPYLNQVERRRSGTDRTVTPDEYASITTDLGMMTSAVNAARELITFERHELGLNGECQLTTAEIAQTNGPVVTQLVGSSTDISIREAQFAPSCSDYDLEHYKV